MPIAPADFIPVALNLHRGVVVAAGEACDRTTAGRAYYAAFLAVREALRADYKDRTWDTHHEYLRDDLRASLDPTVADVGNRLATLFTMRTRADYKISKTVSKTDAAFMIANVNAIMTAIPKLRGKWPSVRRR